MRQGGLSVAVRLTPRGGRDALDGIETLSDGRHVLALRVRAMPEDGAANAALCRLVAKGCGVAPSRVRLAAGATARIKRLTIDGEPDVLAAAFETWIGGTGDRTG
jgi:uncharacterized protein YggU (UPF0235/DUF167 family)